MQVNYSLFFDPALGLTEEQKSEFVKINFVGPNQEIDSIMVNRFAARQITVINEMIEAGDEEITLPQRVSKAAFLILLSQVDAINNPRRWVEDLNLAAVLQQNSLASESIQKLASLLQQDDIYERLYEGDTSIVQTVSQICPEMQTNLLKSFPKKLFFGEISEFFDINSDFTPSFFLPNGQAAIVRDDTPNGSVMAFNLNTGNMDLVPCNGAVLERQTTDLKTTLDGRYSILFENGDPSYQIRDNQTNEVRIYDNGEPVWNFTEGGVDYESVKSLENVTFSPDGNFVASSSRNGTAIIRNVLTGEVCYKITHDEVVQFALFSPNGRSLITTVSDYSSRLVSLYNITNLKQFLLLQLLDKANEHGRTVRLDEQWKRDAFFSFEPIDQSYLMLEFEGTLQRT